VRLNINLATSPYEDVRRFLARWGILAALLAVITAGLVYLAISNWRSSRAINAQITDYQEKINQLERDRTNAAETLNKPENKAVSGTSRFFNDVIQRKSLSWTRVFMDLERIMPTGLHVVSITPELNKDNQLIIRLAVGGNSHEKAVDLVHRMEESSTFRRPQLHSENAIQGTGDTIQFEITSQYVPSPAVTSEPPSRAEVKPEQSLAKGGTR